MKDIINSISKLFEDIELIKIIVPSFTTMIVALVGFGLNLNLTKKSLNNEISKYKSNNQLEKLQEIPMELLYCIELIVTPNFALFSFQRESEEGKLFWDKIVSVKNLITAYGNKDAVKIIGHLEQHLFSTNQKYSQSNIKFMLDEDKIEFIVYITLLLCQLKLDLTNKVMKPNLYYRCRINEKSDIFKQNYKYMEELNNKIVTDLKLKKSFKIKYKNIENDEYVNINIRKAA